MTINDKENVFFLKRCEILSLMLWVAIILVIQNDANILRMTETLTNGYSSNEYLFDRVWMVFKNLCALDKSSLSNGRATM